jgi:hypothetical protein
VEGNTIVTRNPELSKIIRFFSIQLPLIDPVDDCVRNVISPVADSLNVGNQMLYHTPEEFPFFPLPSKRFAQIRVNREK